MLPHQIVGPVPFTLAHYADAYLRRAWNLSCVPPPPTAPGGFYKAPAAYNEALRAAAAAHTHALVAWRVRRQALEQVVRQAALLLGTQSAALSIVTASRVHTMSGVAWGVVLASRGLLFAGHAVLLQGPLVVQDTHEDWRFRLNPFVCGAPHVRFYAAVPFWLHDRREVVGCLAVHASTARKVSAPQLARLAAAADEAHGLVYAPVASHEHCPPPLAQTILELDGSTPYTAAREVRIARLLAPTANARLWRALYRVHNPKLAACALSTALVHELELELVCVAAVKTAEPFRIDAARFPPENKIYAANFRYALAMARVGLEQVLLRVLGGSGAPLASTLLAALQLEWGVVCAGGGRSSIVMPFSRSAAKLVRSRPFRADRKPPAGDIGVVLQLAAYVVVATRAGPWLPEEVARVYAAAATFRSIYLCS